MKKIIALLLACLQIISMPRIALNEEALLPSYQESLLPLPEGYIWLGMGREPGGSLLVLGRHADGTHALLRWRGTEAMPEIIALADLGESLRSMRVAADGEIMLSSLPRKRGASEDVIAGSVIWVSPSGQEITRFDIESDATIHITEPLSGRRVAFASADTSEDLLVYDDQGIVLYSVPQLPVDSLLFGEEALHVFSSGTIFTLSADTGDRTHSLPVAFGMVEATSMGQDGEIYIAEGSGIYELRLADEGAEKRMDSMGTLFGGMNAYIRDCIALPDGAFAIAIGNIKEVAQENLADDSVFIAIYKPVEGMKNRVPFVITRMDDFSEVIEEAASVFQRKHPELDVQLRTFHTFWDGGLTKEDASRVVITEFLAVGGGDVMVLDLFPVDSMMKKGMLRDIAHLVPELSLVPGIAESLTYADGKVYAIPAQFSIPTLMGRDKAVSGIHAFADILSVPIDPYEMRIDNSDYTVMEMLKMCMGDFLNEQGQIDFLSKDFIAFLEILRQIHIEGQHSPATGDVALAIGARNNINMLEVLYTEFGEEEARILPMPTMHGDSKQYIPEVQLGIPTSARNPELSEEFICLALSEEMGLGINEYFSTVPSLLDLLFEEKIKKNEKEGQYIVHTVMGSRLEFAVPSEEYLMALHALLYEVTEPLPTVDDQVIAFIMDELPTLYEGTATAEQAAQRVEQRAFLFLNE